MPDDQNRPNSRHYWSENARFRAAPVFGYGEKQSTAQFAKFILLEINWKKLANHLFVKYLYH